MIKYLEAIKWLAVPFGIVIGVAFFFGCFSPTAKAFDDSFEMSEGYTLNGGINGINNWSASCASSSEYYVSSASAYDGMQHLSFNESAACSMFNNIADISAGQSCVSVYMNKQPDIPLYVLNGLDGADGTVFSIRISSDGSIYYWVGAWVDSTYNQTIGSYNNYCVEFDANANTRDYIINGNTIAADAAINDLARLQFSTDGWTIQTGVFMYVDFFRSDITALPQTPDVNIIYPDNIDGSVFIGSHTFTFPQVQECLIATSCPVTIFYRYEDVGSTLYFMNTEDESLENAEDVLVLADKPLLKDIVYPDIQSVETTEEYSYFISPDTGSSTLFGFTKIYWVTELSENSGDQTFWGIVISSLKNIFPLSILYQIKDAAYDIRTNKNNTEYIDIGIDDLAHENFKAQIGTSTILGKSLIEDNLPVWNAEIYPFLQGIVYVMNIIFVIFLLSPKSSKE